jgi:predicted ATPase
LPKITALLESHRLVTIVGSGGVDKTRTSVHVGAHLLDGSGDGVWFIELAPLAIGDYLPTTVAQAMGITLRGEGDPLASLVGVVKAKKALLIFDNCEHIIESAARAIGALLRDCPQIRILASTRQSLGISGEIAYRMPSLTTPDGLRALTAADARQYPAIALFVERAAAVDHRFTLSDDNAPVIGEICRHLDGIPLAIELAAARVKILSPRQLREGLDERFRVLTGKRRDLLPRQQTLRALIDWSYDLLDKRERALFRRLGVFVSGFTLDGALAVGSGETLDELDVFEVLASLVDQSLVLAEPDGDALRYRMLESTQAYAREKLAAEGEYSVSVTRHLYHLRDLFAAAMTRAKQTGNSTEIETLLIAKLDDVRVALEGVGASVERATAAELLAAIDSRWQRVGLGSEGSARLERFIALMPADEQRLTALLWTALARITRDTKPVEALPAAATAVRLARVANDPEVLAEALVALADKLARALAFDDAEAAVNEAEALATPGTLGCACES